jgi:phosphotransferase system HPr-like phosphotransfer protein
MPERSLEEVVTERAFAGLLQSRAETFFRLSNTLLGRVAKDWNKKHFYQLLSEADELESFLDDYGARYNRTYNYIRELVASLRWFGQTGFSLAHLEGRLTSYGVLDLMSPEDQRDALESLAAARNFVRSTCIVLLQAVRTEADALGLERTPEAFSETELAAGATRHLLPRNVGQEDPLDEGQKIAEVASKYIAANRMLTDLHVRRITRPQERVEFLGRICTEEQARVYEATVHNLQSTYDTYIKNTVLEGQDERLPRLRGHLSAALHLLEAVTFLTHFVERHESGSRTAEGEGKILHLVDRALVQDVVLNTLLYWAQRIMQRGGQLAEELLPAYTNLQELTVELPADLRLHARPAALIVAIVGHYGTPVELEVGGTRCDASSILDVLVTVGSHPESRTFVFRGDENPLRDIGLLFEHALGEDGIDGLPPELGYLKS